MKRTLLLLVLALTGAHADSLLYTITGTDGKARERTVPLTPGTFLRISGSGTLVVESGTAFKSALGLAALATSGSWADVADKPDPVITAQGDATGSVTLTDVGSGTMALTLADSGVVSGTYGSASLVPRIGVDAKGRVISVESSTITPGAIGAVSVASGSANNLTISGTLRDADGIPIMDASGGGVRNIYTGEGELAIDVGSRAQVGSWSATSSMLYSSTLRGTTVLDGTFSGTGQIPGANVQASGTGNPGVSFFATDSEIQTGTDTAKSVRVSGLAAWWTYIKTQAQTISGRWTFTGTATMNVATATTATVTTGTVGTLNVTGNTIVGGQLTLPNQVASSSGDALSLALGKQLFLDTEFSGKVHRYVLTGWRTAVTGAGAVRGWPDGQGGLILRTSTTGTSSASAVNAGTVNASTFVAAPGGDTRFINWSGRVRIWVKFGEMVGLSTNCVYRGWLGWPGGSAPSTADPIERGIGFRVVYSGASFNGSLYGQVHNGTTLTTSGSAFSVVQNRVPQSLLIDSLGNGTVNFYVGGALVGTMTGGPTGNSVSGYINLLFSVDNGGDASDATLGVSAATLVIGDL